MRVLVIGSGAREHALVWKLSQSEQVTKIFAAPGNPGMSALAEGIPLEADKITELYGFAVSSKIDLTVVGPETPLVGGIVNYFRERNAPIFGPTKEAARLEGSKVFAKSIMERYGVPTAQAAVFKKSQEALKSIDPWRGPVVVKADGLAAGKGVVVARTKEEAAEAIHKMLDEKIFGESGSQIMIEECLEGEEISILALVDGKQFVILAPSQDHKRVFDGDQGPNTGGMGAYSPVPMVDDLLMEEIRRTIFEPVIQGMNREGAPFTGILYAGLMLTTHGPRVLEFNVRFGDPEAQAILPRLKSDLAQMMLAAAQGRLSTAKPVAWDPRSCACVVLASKGYPSKYDIGREITGLNQVSDFPDTLVFHAGTSMEGGRFLTRGGRVLSVVALGSSLELALEKAYQAVDQIQFEGKQFRRDIGARALKWKALKTVPGTKTEKLL